MKRKFIQNLILLILLNLLVKPFWVFGIDRTVQNIVGAEEYGLYFSLFSFSVMLNILLDAGITSFNNRSIARDGSVLSDYFAHIVPLKFLLAVFYAAVCIITGLIIGYSASEFRILYLLILNNFLLSFILYLRSNISGLQLFRMDSFLSVLDRLLMILICSLLIWGKINDIPLNILNFIYAQTLAYVITMLVILVILLFRTGRIRLQFSFIKGWKIIRQAFPFALLTLLMALFTRIDSVIIERMLPDGKFQAGLYAQAFRLLDAVSMFAFLFAGLLLPMFSNMLKKKEPVDQLLNLSFSLLILPVLTLVTASVFYGDELISFLYNEQTDTSSRIYSRLIIAFPFIAVTYIFGSLLTANGNLFKIIILAGITAAINIILNIILIPLYKAEGAAFACIISQGFFAAGQVFLVVRVKLLKTDPSILTRYAVFAILLVISGHLLGRSGISWYAGFLIIILLAIIYSWYMKIVSVKNILITLSKGDNC